MPKEKKQCNKQSRQVQQDEWCQDATKQPTNNLLIQKDHTQLHEKHNAIAQHACHPTMTNHNCSLEF